MCMLCKSVQVGAEGMGSWDGRWGSHKLEEQPRRADISVDEGREQVGRMAGSPKLIEATVVTLVWAVVGPFKALGKGCCRRQWNVWIADWIGGGHDGRTKTN